MYKTSCNFFRDRGIQYRQGNSKYNKRISDCVQSRLPGALKVVRLLSEFEYRPDGTVWVKAFVETVRAPVYGKLRNTLCPLAIVTKSMQILERQAPRPSRLPDVLQVKRLLSKFEYRPDGTVWVKAFVETVRAPVYGKLLNTRSPLVIVTKKMHILERQAPRPKPCSY